MKTFALIFGIIFLVFGIVGFINTESTSKLNNVFKFNIWLNFLYIVTGTVSTFVICTERRICILFFKILGACFAIFALLGFIYGNTDILGVFASNQSNSWFHVIISIAALVLGYGASE